MGPGAASQEPVDSNSQEKKSSHRQDTRLEDIRMMRQKPLIRPPATTAGVGGAGSGSSSTGSYLGRSYYDDLAVMPGRCEQNGSSENGHDEAEGSDAENDEEKQPLQTLVEPLQIILRAQVDALVCAGYPAELEVSSFIHFLCFCIVIALTLTL